MLYKGSNKIGQVYKGNTKIGQIYKGSTLIWSSDPYEPDYVVYERTTAGTETVNILGDGYYEVYCIAGGGGASSSHLGSFLNKVYYCYGASGSGYIGIIFLPKGNLSITIGSGGNYVKSIGKRGESGGNSLIGNYVTTYGGSGGYYHSTVSGGALPTINATQKGNPTLNKAGNNGSKNNAGASVYEGYGAGGSKSTWNGTAGYIKIVYKGQ